MNPLVLLGLGAFALVALGKSKSKGGGGGEPPPQNGGGGEPQDRVVDEGEIESEGGHQYLYRVWETYGGEAKYVGELLLDGNWTSGPMSDSLEDVLSALEDMADSLDPQLGQHTVTPCEEGLPGPFEWYAYDEGTHQWTAINDQLDPAEVQEAGRVWCVLPDDEGGYFSRVVDEESGQVIFESDTVEDADIAASMAYYGLYNPGGPFPWIGFQQQGG